MDASEALPVPDDYQDPIVDLDEASLQNAAGQQGAEAIPQEQSLADAIAERHPDWPRIRMHIRFLSHYSQADFAGFTEYMQNPATRPDIYLVENAINNGQLVDVLQAVSDHGHAEEKIESLGARTTSLGEQLAALDNTGVAVGCIDLRTDVAEEWELYRRTFRSLSALPPAASFDAELDAIITQSRNVSEAQREREAVMLDRLEPELERLLAQRPELQDRLDSQGNRFLQIYLTIGATHTMLYRDFINSGFATDRSFSKKPYIYDYGAQLSRTFSHDPAQAEDSEHMRELAAKTFVESLMYDRLSNSLPQSVDSDDLSLYIRSFVSRFSTAQIRQWYESNPRVGSRPRLDRLLSDEELDELPTNALRLHIAAETIRAGLRRRAD